MTSLEVTGTDAFLDMPQSSQLLYFHLNSLADDDGFVANPKSIMRNCGAQSDDLKLLIAKKFVIAFEDGVCVIKHWRINNFIRKDIYKETKYLNHKQTLFIRANGAYTQTNDGRAVPLQTEEVGKPDWIEARKKARDESELPYSFDYKIRQYFYGKPCPICKIEMRELPVEDVVYGARNNPKPTIQHIIPISGGGKHELDNIAVICFNCNASVRNNPTEKLNNHEVKMAWEAIESQSAQKRNAIGTESVLRLGKGRVGKDRKEPPAQSAAIMKEKFTTLGAEVVKAFEVVDPKNKHYYNNPPQREAADFLVSEYGLEDVLKRISVLPRTNKMPYFPAITTPVQLRDKWVQLQDAVERKRGEIKNKERIII